MSPGSDTPAGSPLPGGCSATPGRSTRTTTTGAPAFRKDRAKSPAVRTTSSPPYGARGSATTRSIRSISTRAVRRGSISVMARRYRPGRDRGGPVDHRTADGG
ncbi:hypothetical protein SMD11_4683 [Streptomyces albireticuli]|uniref:Uncharacterized protein n=1 Tax=Streptomyces albireticuli TaxID=1940 RepID=A0A1Z2L7J0_9ACTN|nr:hypothetical protein SMD11_4683 [Streptomyces albireticuli]